MSAAETVLTDSKGRKLLVKGLTTVEQYRLFKAIGPDAATNVINASMAQCAASVREIDGVPLPYPRSEDGIEMNLERLGDEGYAAYYGWLQASTAAAMLAAQVAGDTGPLDPPPASPDTPA